MPSIGLVNAGGIDSIDRVRPTWAGEVVAHNQAAVADVVPAVQGTPPALHGRVPCPLAARLVDAWGHWEFILTPRQSRIVGTKSV